MVELFKKRKSLEELQEEDDRLTTEYSIAEKKAAIKRLDMEGGQGFWRKFSDNGKLSGLNMGRVLAWFRGRGSN